MQAAYRVVRAELRVVLDHEVVADVPVCRSSVDLVVIPVCRSSVDLVVILPRPAFTPDFKYFGVGNQIQFAHFHVRKVFRAPRRSNPGKLHSISVLGVSGLGILVQVRYALALEISCAALQQRLIGFLAFLNIVLVKVLWKLAHFRDFRKLLPHSFIAVLVGFVPAVRIVQLFCKVCSGANKGVVIQLLRTACGKPSQGVGGGKDHSLLHPIIDNGRVLIKVKVLPIVQRMGRAGFLHLLFLCSGVLRAGRFPEAVAFLRDKAILLHRLLKLLTAQLLFGFTVACSIFKEACEAVLHILSDILIEVGVLPALLLAPRLSLIGEEFLLPDLADGAYIISPQALHIEVLIHGVCHGFQLVYCHGEPGTELDLLLHHCLDIVTNRHESVVRFLQIGFHAVVDALGAHNLCNVLGKLVGWKAGIEHRIQVLHNACGDHNERLGEVAPHLLKLLRCLRFHLIRVLIRVSTLNGWQIIIFHVLPERIVIRLELYQALFILFLIYPGICSMTCGNQKILEPRFRLRHCAFLVGMS